MPDVTKEVEEAYKKLSEQGQLPEQMTAQEVKQQLDQQKLLEKQAVPVGSQIRWQFYDIGPIDPNGFIFMRFKYDVSVNPPDLRDLWQMVYWRRPAIGTRCICVKNAYICY